MVYDSSNSVINAARDLADMERRRKCFSDEERAKVPLFLDPKSKKAVTSSYFCKMLKTVLTLAFGEDEAKKYGSHSFRKLAVQTPQLKELCFIEVWHENWDRCLGLLGKSGSDHRWHANRPSQARHHYLARLFQARWY